MVAVGSRMTDSFSIEPEIAWRRAKLQEAREFARATVPAFTSAKDIERAVQAEYLRLTGGVPLSAFQDALVPRPPQA